MDWGHLKLWMLFRSLRKRKLGVGKNSVRAGPRVNGVHHQRVKVGIG